MSKLKPRIKHISLAFMGEGWGDCYIDFRALRWADVANLETDGKDNRQAVTVLLEVLKQNFLSGRGVSEDGQPVELDAADLDELDLEALTAISQQLGGAPSPNA
ncbi:MAG: hypothetical protein M3Q71_00065 [Chloroflexota bacterium]|nr:hypothetical protein [Chloroflexota bacterium]